MTGKPGILEKNPAFKTFRCFFQTQAHPQRRGRPKHGPRGFVAASAQRLCCIWNSFLRTKVAKLEAGPGIFRIARIEISVRQWISAGTSLAFGDTTTRWPLCLRTGSTPYWGTERHRSRQVNGLGDCPSGPIRNLPIFGIRVSKCVCASGSADRGH